jgi:hypothetical protein
MVEVSMKLEAILGLPEALEIVIAIRKIKPKVSVIIEFANNILMGLYHLTVPA